jgi:hypothetical protein
MAFIYAISVVNRHILFNLVGSQLLRLCFPVLKRVPTLESYDVAHVSRARIACMSDVESNCLFCFVGISQPAAEHFFLA